MLARQRDPIVAVATAPGRGAVGIVRVSGRGIQGVVQALCGRPLTPRHATFCPFLGDAGEAIDQGLALYFPAPHSYTGEDVLELQAHGGPVLLQLLLARCLQAGADIGLRLAEPGEFTERAFLNDKLDLAQAEAVADLIDASTEAAARSASRSLSGVFSAEVQALRDRADEPAHAGGGHAGLSRRRDRLPGAGRRRAGRSTRCSHAVRRVLDARTPRRAAARGHQGGAGRPAQRRQEQPAERAGRGRAGHRHAHPRHHARQGQQTIQIEGVPLHVIDTAGLREAEMPATRWSASASSAQLGRSREADAVILLHDITRRGEPDYEARHPRRHRRAAGLRRP
jgi:tRNA modification GTPase